MTSPAWILVAWAHQFRRELNALAPNRDKTTDGSIGNLYHTTYPSGHNPDETGNAERRDADTINEVRAIDTDRDTRHPELTAERIVAYLVGRCRAGLEPRLIYIIFNRVIWSASSGWVARAYTGYSPHDMHWHMSGHPDYDTDSRPWGLASLLTTEVPDLDATQAKQLADAHWVLTHINGNQPHHTAMTLLMESVAALAAAVANIAKGTADDVTTAQLTAIGARMEALAAQDAARDLQLLEVVQAFQAGDLAAQEVADRVVDLMGMKLTQAAP